MGKVVPDGFRVPGVYSDFDTTSRVSTLAAVNLSVAIIAQKLSAGTAEENKPIQVFSTGDVTTQAGAGSQAEAMARAALTANRNMTLYMVYQEDSGTGVAATGTLTVTGTATNTGTIVVYIGDQRVEVLVNNGDDQDAIALAIDTAISGAQDRLLVDATSATNVATITARNKGTVGNDIPIGVDESAVGGVTVAVVQLASGANDPVFQDALDSLDGLNIGFVVSQNSDATTLTTFETWLRGEADPIVGRRIKGFTGLSFVDIATASTRATGVDYERITIGYRRANKSDARTKYVSSKIGAAYCAGYVSISDPALPRTNVVLNGMPAADFNDFLGTTEKNTLINNGVAPITTMGNNSVINRSVSTKTTTNGVNDYTLLDIQITDSLDFIALALETRLSINYQRVKITDRIKKNIKSTVLSVLYLIEDGEIVRDVAENQDGVIVSEDVTNNGQLNLTIPAEVVQGLYVIAQEIVLIVDPGGNNA